MEIESKTKNKKKEGVFLKKLKIKNYRSIKDVEIELDPKINAFIGPNNVGKSNIMQALNLILGEKWPSTASFEDTDFYNCDKTEPIEIEVYFTNSLENKRDGQEIWGFKLTFDGNQCDYICIDNSGKPLSYSPFTDKTKVIKVSQDLKDKLTVILISLDRLASQQLRPNQWTQYGKILKKLYENIPNNKNENFRNTLTKAFDDYLYEHIKEFEDILLKHVQSQTGHKLKLKLSIIDPIQTIKNLRPYFIENEKEFDVEEMGAGIQSALAIAIARAYKKIVKESPILIIEEPELFLHPHACRHFYKLLKEISNEGIQIIYTTHERSFVNVADYKHIRIVKKNNNETKVYCFNSGISGFDEVKLASKFDEKINEVFFADFVILVEGFTDKIACQLALEKLGVDLDLCNISIIDCGSKTAIKPFAKILKEFNVKTCVLIDNDAENEKKQLKGILGDDFVLVQEPNLEGMLGMKDSKENEKLNRERAMKELPNYFQKKSDSEIPEIYKKCKKLINENC